VRPLPSQFYREAFVKAFANIEGYEVYTVYVTNFQNSTVGTTLMYFDHVLYGTDYDKVNEEAAVQALFNGTDPGSPALPPLVNAFVANGLPVAGAYYNDQYTPSAYVSPVPTAINASQVGTWTHADSGEVMALDINYDLYASKQQYYKQAFTAALADTLGMGYEAVWVNDFQQSAAGTTLIYFDVSLSATTSEAISATFLGIESLFTDCHPATGDRVGCPAGANSTLVQAMLQYGLPLTNVYYNQQPAPP
jgi:hypothetical protein